MRLRSFPLLAGALVLCGGTATAQTKTGSRDDDARLAQHVSIQSPAIYVGNLCEVLSEKTGVHITASDRDTASLPILTVFIEDMTASRLMDAMASLLSYKHAEWVWEVTGPKDRPEYILRRPLGARGFAGQFRAEILKKFEQAASILIEVAGMPREDRSRERKRLSEAMLQDDDKVADAMLGETRIWEGLNLLSGAVPADQRSQVLRGERNVKVPVDALDPAGREFVHGEWAFTTSDGTATRRRSDGTREPVPPPSFVTVYTSQSESLLTPNLIVGLEGLGGYSYAGGMPMHTALMRMMRKMWQTEGDEAEDSAADRLPVETDSPPLDPKWTQVTRYIANMARRYKVPILARLTGDAGFSGPKGPSLREAIANLDDVSLIAKWRNHVLLLDSPLWIWHEPKAVPWPAVRTMRDSARNNGGYASLSDIVNVACSLDAPKLSKLCGTYPSLTALALAPELIQLCSEDRSAKAALLSEKGLALTADRREKFQGSAGLKFALDREDVTAIRLSVMGNPYGDHLGRYVQLQALTPKGPLIIGSALEKPAKTDENP